MTERPLIVVFGATGSQGGSVVDSLVKDGSFRVRGISRNPSGSKAQTLKEKGVEVVKADQSNLDEVKSALEGAYGVYGVTNFWDPASMGKEVQLGGDMARAAKEAGVQHFMWSTLPNVQSESGDKYDVPHFTHKAKVDDIIKGLGFKYTTFIQCGFYYQNVSIFHLAETKPDGRVVFNMPVMGPDDTLAAYDVEDTGPAALTAFKKPQESNGQTYHFAATNEPLKNYLSTFQEVTGVKAELNSIPYNEAAKQNEELAQMFAWFKEYGYYGKVDPNNLRNAEKLMGHLTTWREWLEKSGWKGPPPFSR